MNPDKLKNTDIRLTEKFKNELPSALTNEWFTPRLMNRLPQKRNNNAARLVQWACYLIATVALVASSLIAIDNTVNNGLTISSLLLLIATPMIIISCLAIFAIPSLKQVCDGDFNILH